MIMDWARFAQMLLNDREYEGQALPKPETLAFIAHFRDCAIHIMT
jgi:hypothetical protein